MTATARARGKGGRVVTAPALVAPSVAAHATFRSGVRPDWAPQRQSPSAQSSPVAGSGADGFTGLPRRGGDGTARPTAADARRTGVEIRGQQNEVIRLLSP